MNRTKILPPARFVRLIFDESVRTGLFQCTASFRTKSTTLMIFTIAIAQLPVISGFAKTWFIAITRPCDWDRQSRRKLPIPSAVA